ncbi:MAG: putative pterin-4-alpha-carbinolamine dehydratase [Parcubacteria group bacterium]|nr:putative pterin-4-alpha-carbinolamine dehydratase [Parcubacteria group bacterium]
MEHIPLWSLNDDSTEISRLFRFKDFKEALAFTNEVGKLAEEEYHHPELMLGWGKVGVRLKTNSIGGLSENDFILAVKIDLI